MNDADKLLRAFLADSLALSARLGVEGAVQGRHVAGPSRQQSIVQLPAVMAALTELLGRSAPTNARPVVGLTTTSTEPSRARFRGLLD